MAEQLIAVKKPKDLDAYDTSEGIFSEVAEIGRAHV